MRYLLDPPYFVAVDELKSDELENNATMRFAYPCAIASAKEKKKRKSTDGRTFTPTIITSTLIHRSLHSLGLKKREKKKRGRRKEKAGKGKVNRRSIGGGGQSSSKLGGELLKKEDEPAREIGCPLIEAKKQQKIWR